VLEETEKADAIPAGVWGAPCVGIITQRHLLGLEELAPELRRVGVFSQGGDSHLTLVAHMGWGVAL
jgi:hypothetical protein